MQGVKALIDTSRKIAARKIAIVFHSRRASREGLRTLASARKSFSDVLENETLAYCVSSIGVRVFIVNINIDQLCIGPDVK